MEKYWIIIIPIGIAISLYIAWITDSSKDFKDIVEVELKKKGFKLISLTYPGLFKVGPFKKIEVSFGKPKINDGAIQYEKTYYRIAEVKTLKNKTNKIWVKIETSWFKESKVEFKEVENKN